MAWAYEHFARDFLRDRIDYLERDIRICLRSYRSKLTDRMSGGSRSVHGYWPALMTSLATLELAAKLMAGSNKSMDWIKVDQYVRQFLRPSQPRYTSERVHLLWYGFRHALAHGARPSYVIEFRPKGQSGRPMRIAWAISSESEKNLLKSLGHGHLDLVADVGSIKTKIRPWDVRFDHRFYVSLRQLKDDVKLSMEKFHLMLNGNSTLQRNFLSVMASVYPR